MATAFKFEHKEVSTEGVVFLSKDETGETLLDGAGVIGKSVHVSYLGQGAVGADRWEVTETATFYECPES